jgi:hypothetical protein
MVKSQVEALSPQGHFDSLQVVNITFRVVYVVWRWSASRPDHVVENYCNDAEMSALIQ